MRQSKIEPFASRHITRRAGADLLVGSINVNEDNVISKLARQDCLKKSIVVCSLN